MNRRHFLSMASLAAVAAVRPLSSFARRDDVGFTALRRGAGTFVGRGGTIGWLATSDALVVVDTQFPDTAAQFWTGLQNRVQERTQWQIDLLVNTHHHGDHTAGNQALRPHAKQHVAHRNVPVLQQQAHRRTVEQGRETPAPVVPGVTFDDTWSLDVGGETVRLYYYGPAHTRGDAVVHFEQADVAHMGDLVFNRLPAFFDPPGGSTVRGWIDVLEKSHAGFGDDTVFIFGHGSPAAGITGTRADLLVARDFLSGLMEYVEKGIAAGTPLDDLAAIDRLPAFPDHFNPDWANALGGSIRAVHAELSEP